MKRDIYNDEIDSRSDHLRLTIVVFGSGHRGDFLAASSLRPTRFHGPGNSNRKRMTRMKFMKDEKTGEESENVES